MIKLEKAIIVEGKYDKIRLENIVDAPIIVTNGFSVFKDKEKLELIKRLAQKSGIIILTDSDSAGMMIRSYLKGCIPSELITHVYIPEILGKEKRKVKASSAGLLGVEGVDDNLILKAFSRAGVLCQKTDKKGQQVTHTDLFELGLSGSDNSKALRQSLLIKLSLPSKMSTNSMLTAINALYDYDEFISLAKEAEVN
ncbi:MAG: DUF4093 domain-containing protein [Oscillospiraceae bacterium]|nr:DUF4093 domain-containing protein [Oscillospiraceae bacterium]